MGSLWYQYRDKIDNFLKRFFFPIIMSLIVLFYIYDHSNIAPTLGGVFHNFRSILFAGIIICLTIIFPIKVSFLAFLGQRLFPLYIYQRLPMIYFSEFDGGVFMSEQPYLYIGLCLAVTLFIGCIYRYVEIRTLKMPAFLKSTTKTA